MALTALDLGLRGVAVGFFLLTCALLLRDWPSFSTLAALRVALGAGGTAYAISTAPFFPLGSFGWNTPFVILYAGLPVIFWLWALAAFNDSFVLRPYHLAIWAFVAGLGLFAYCGWATSPALSVMSGRMFALATIAFALLAAAQTIRIWRAELAAGCRRPLIAFLLAATVFTVVNAACGLAAIPWQSVSFSFALGLGVLAVFGVWISFPKFMGQPALAGAAGEVRTGVAGEVRKKALSCAPPTPPDLAWQRQLEKLMTVERVYRQESLSIGILAVKLGIPEHRLRTLINDLCAAGSYVESPNTASYFALCLCVERRATPHNH
jgi:hypothetical protein